MFESFKLPSGTDAVSSTVDNPTNALVIIPDVLGLRPLYHDHVKRISEENNWNVVSFELYAEAAHLETVDERFDWAPNLEDDRVLGDAIAAADKITTELGLDLHVGLTGFCMGGMYTMKSMTRDRFDRRVSFYGQIDITERWQSATQGEPLEMIPHGDPSTLLAIVAEDDHWTPPEKVDALRATGIQIAMFSGCEHGFVHDPNRREHRADDAAEAWRIALEFLSGK